jgi:hypothetical protein
MQNILSINTALEPVVNIIKKEIIIYPKNAMDLGMDAV